jgi:hypothetical protein
MHKQIGSFGPTDLLGDFPDTVDVPPNRWDDIGQKKPKSHYKP